MKRRFFTMLCSTLTVLASATTLLAQERGTIRGTIEDATGAVVTTATVTATNIDTGVLNSAQTTDAGFYSIGQLQPGTYRVEVEAPGFKRLVHQNVRVDVAAVVGVDLRLEVGETNQSVTVEAVAPQIRSETVEVGTAIPPKGMVDLPLVANGGRAPIAFVFLAPGAAGSTFEAHINGGQGFTMEMQMDGLSLQSGPWVNTGREMVSPPEAVEEVSLAASQYSAEFMSGGGVARFTTRSGTNQFHGNLYEFVRNNAFDARGFFARSVPPLKQNEFGGSIGGPVLIPKLYNGKNRTFLFANLNFFRLRGSGTNALTSTPPQSFRNGDFTQLGIPIYDPATTAPTAGGGFTRQPFAGNIIPQNRISSVSRNILGYVADPQLPGFFNNYPSLSYNTTNWWTLTTKLDHRFTSNHSISLSFSNKMPEQFSYSGLPLPVSNSQSRSALNQHNYRAAYDWVVSPSMSNHLSFGYNRQTEFSGLSSVGGGWDKTLGLRGVPSSEGINGQFPVINMSPYTFSAALGSGEGVSYFWHDIVMVSDSFSMIRGKHSIKFGFDLRKLHIGQLTGSNNGIFTFGQSATADPSALSTTGFAFASFLLGAAQQAQVADTVQTSGDQSGTNLLTRTRSTYFGLYIQDDLKLTRNLTLNLGVRWDIFTPLYDAGDNYTVMDPTRANPSAGGIPGALVFAGTGPGRYGSKRLPGADQIDYKNFSPRLGVAWKLTPRVVLRAGYGISIFPSSINLQGNLRRSSLGFEAYPLSVSPDGGITPAIYWDNGFAAYQKPPLIDPGFAVGGVANMWWGEMWRSPYMQNWSTNIQVQLAKDWLLDIGYVGSKGTRLATGVFNVNQVNSQYLTLGDLLRQPINSPAVVAAGFRPPYPGFSGSLAQALRPFPQYSYVATVGNIGGSNPNSVNVGNSTYHALQVKVEKQFSAGLYLLSSFVWSKTLTDSNSNWGGFFGSNARDQYNRRLEKGLAATDVPARFVTALNYELPIGPNKRFAGGVRGVSAKLIEGWQVNGIFTYQSGTPIKVGVNNSLPLFNDGNYPDVVSGVPQTLSFSDPAKDRYLNINAFAAPAAFRFGNAPPFLDVRQFLSLNENFGVLKRTYIREQLNLEFRFEAFNVFNRVRFGGPGTNVSQPFSFGVVGGQGNTPRQCQFALKLNF